MKKIEKILSLLFFVSLILVYSRIPLGKAFFTIVSLVMSIYYLLGSILLFNGIDVRQAFSKHAYSHASVKEIVMSILTGIGLVYYMLGLLFLVNNWPISQTRVIVYSSLLLLLPCIGACAIFFILNRHATYKRILARLSIAIVLLGIILGLQYLQNVHWI